MANSKNAKLILEDGSTFEGHSFGFEESTSGEVVFNTGMVGYYESLTDPSYTGQVLSLTYPLIGNYGIPEPLRELATRALSAARNQGKLKEKNSQMHSFFESHKIHARALIVNTYSDNFSHFEAKKSLSEWLKEQKIPAITGIDTRALTKKLREKGVMLGKIIIDEKEVEFFDPNKINIVEEVSCKEPLTYQTTKKPEKKVVLIDCGVKNNIIRSLLSRNVEVTRVPFDYNFFDKKIDFDAIVLSNGPGDPKMCKETILIIKTAMQKEIPTFGICLGNQLLALAAGGDTYKLKYGHRGQNQPCILEDTKKCFVTSQNHGFAVDIKSLPKDEWQTWFTNLNDKTNEGIIHKTKPFMSVQFHPEASPGPVDAGFLFDEFLRKIK